MTAFSRRVAELTGVSEERLERLSGGDLSEVLLVPRVDGRLLVAKGGAAVGTEATMLRLLLSNSIPAPMVEAEHEGLLLLDYVENDGVFSPVAWSDIGQSLRRLHAQAGDRFGWPADFRIGTVELDNRHSDDWPGFWGTQRLAVTASVLDRPWRERVERLAPRLPAILPASPLPSLLHGDLWTGNILVSGGKLAALIDPACYHGHSEVDLAMLTLFADPPDEFWEAYGELEPGWEQRQAAYQLFPALVHLRLFGSGYAGMVDRLLTRIGA